MATIAFFRTGLVCSIVALLCMFIAFTSPYWYQSWTRVHSSFGNIGLWNICLNGWIRPRDPIMKSYVGCWWIHSSEFDKVKDDIQPVWFRFVQAFCVFTLLMDLFAVIFAACYISESARARLYLKRPRMFFIISALLLGAAFLVFLISLVFAEKSNDSEWMPRPWMNYLSWSYGLCVLSGFFDAFAGMSFFVLALLFKDKEDNGDPGVTSAAELAARKRELEKQDQAMRQEGAIQMDTRKFGPYGSGSVGPPSHHGSASIQHKPYGHYGSGQIPPPRPQHSSNISVHAPHYGSAGMVRPPPPQYGQAPYKSQPTYRNRPSAPPSVADSHDSRAPESSV